MKRYLFLFVVIALLLASCSRSPGSQAGGPEPASPGSGGQTATVVAKGEVRANQSAYLAWQTRGSVEEVYVAAGDQVEKDQLLATLSEISLPSELILAKTDLVDTQRALEDLRSSRLQQAQALQALEEAQQALEDQVNPGLEQAEALESLAAAQKAVDDARRELEILTKPPSKEAIDQAYANMRLAEYVLKRTQDNIARVEKKLKKPAELYVFFESREFYRRILKNLQIKEPKDRVSYEEAVKKYNRLVNPPNANDVAVAEASLTTAQARLEEAQREWERLKNGPDGAEVAVAKAGVADAQREWERWKDGANEEELAAAEARVAAAQATLEQSRLTAPFAGTITEVKTKPGDQVAKELRAFRLDDLSRLYLDVQVSEIDVNRVETGQQVSLAFDSIPGEEYQGQVTQVSLVGREDQGIVVFNVRVELMDFDEKVKPGMTADATIFVE